MAEIAETKYGLDGKVTFEQSDGGIKVVDLANLGGAAGAGVTNIGVVPTTTTVSITSDTGNPGIIPAATPALAGIMSAEQASKLDAQPIAPVVSVAGKTGVVALTGADVGLGSVNNTSDTAKPISTATQLALNQKQNTLTVPGDVPGLTTALAGKQATLTAYTEVPGLTVALNAKQATLTGVADVPNLQAALDLKQGRLAAGTNKLLAAPSALGGAPTQVTIGANLAFDGTTLSSTASGGGSTTYAGLTDAATVNLPTVNTALQTALANKQSSIPVSAGSVLGSPSVLGGNPLPVAVVNDLVTGGSTSLASAETVKILGTNKADKISGVSVSTAGSFDLTESLHNGRRIVVTVPGVVFTRNTTWSSDAFGCFLDVDADGTFTLGTGITIPSGAANSSATAAGGAVDLSCVDGILSSKTPVQAVLAGALGASTTQAPTHSAVSDAIAAVVGGSNLIGVIAPSVFNTIPPSATIAAGTAVGATITVPAGTLGTRGSVTVKWEMQKTGTTDALAYALRVGPIGGTAATATEIQLIGPTAANPTTVFSQRIRATGTTMRGVKHGLPYPEYWTTSANAISIPVDQANGFVIYIICITSTTDSVNVMGAHAEYVKVV